jgi:exonuclease III
MDFGKNIKIQTWNIRHGGKKTEINNIIKSMKEHDADTIVITEFRNNCNGINIQSEMKASGWAYQYSTLPPENQNGILVLSKLELVMNYPDYPLPKAQHRWIDLSFKHVNLSIIGIHIPGYKDKWDKKDFWTSLIQFSKLNTKKNYVIIGDFNTGLELDCEGAMFKYKEFMEELISIGWIDSWRSQHGDKREYTWYSNTGNGFRIDYAFLSRNMEDRLVNVYHSHQERINKYSDHSSLLVEVETNDTN